MCLNDEEIILSFKYDAYTGKDPDIRNIKLVKLKEHDDCRTCSEYKHCVEGKMFEPYLDIEDFEIFDIETIPELAKIFNK